MRRGLAAVPGRPSARRGRPLAYHRGVRRFELERFTDPQAFSAAVTPFLLRREAANCLQLGLLPLLAEGGVQGPYMAVVKEPGGGTAMVALQTPPHRLVLSEALVEGGADAGAPAGAATLEALVEPLLADAPDAPGVLGPVTVAAALARAWGGRRGARARRTMRERVYACTAVAPVAGAPGEMVRARPEQRDLLVDLVTSFRQEALPNDPAATREGVTAGVERDLASTSGGLWLWVDGGRPVSLAGARGATPHGIRVGPVYTPPELRGRGYATALTAALTSRLLAGGRQHVTLFTDLANPTSNAIYRRIGYAPVSDRDVYDFG